MLKCHKPLVRLFQNGTGGHQVISKNQACQEICCHVLTCARSATANRQSQNGLLGLSRRVSARHPPVLHGCQSHRNQKKKKKPSAFASFPNSCCPDGVNRPLHPRPVIPFTLPFTRNLKERHTFRGPRWLAAVRQSGRPPTASLSLHKCSFLGAFGEFAPRVQSFLLSPLGELNSP